MTQAQADALDRAQLGSSLGNVPAILRGFIEKGIAPHEIKPRENIFTYQAWRALDRQVKKGEHGVRVRTFIPVNKRDVDPRTGRPEKSSHKFARTVTVFHISQTKAVD